MRVAFDKLALSFGPIHNNGRYWDTFELYAFYKAALSTLPTITEGDLPILASDYEQTITELRSIIKAQNDMIRQARDVLNYWIPIDEPNPHCTDKINKFHQQKWLESCGVLTNLNTILGEP